MGCINPRRILAAIAGLIPLLAIGSCWTAAPALADPSPYCRPYVDAPHALGLPRPEGETYSFTTQVNVSLHCNGPVYDSRIVGILHYQTDPAAIGAPSSGAYSGPACGRGSCDTYAIYSRTLYCDLVYEFTDHGQITGFWQRTASSSRVNISLDGPTTQGSAYHPRGCA
jgi:hypothetical protein